MIMMMILRPKATVTTANRDLKSSPASDDRLITRLHLVHVGMMHATINNHFQVNYQKKKYLYHDITGGNSVSQGLMNSRII